MPDNEIINNEEIVSSEEIINNEEIADNGYTAAAEAAAPAEEPVSPETAVPSEAEETASPVQGSEAEVAVVNDSPVDCQSRDLTEPAGETVASEAEPRMTEGLLTSDKPQSDSNADNPAPSPAEGGAPSDEGAVEDGSPSETEGVNPAPAAADSAPADAPALDYVKMTLSSGIAPLEMRFAQINSCYRRLPVAYRSFTYINSVLEGVIPPEKYAYAADETDRGERLARWNIAKAVEAIQTFEAFGRNVDFVTARVPASLTRQPDLYSWMKDLLGQLKLEDPSKLCLEFPRTLLYEEVGTARTSLLSMKLLKVRTLMTGCGERDCPVTALVELPVDMVLLSPHVSAMSDNRDKNHVFAAFVNFLRSLPVDVIGDGIYNDDQITAHSRADCSGYIPSAGYEGGVEHGGLRMTLEEAVEQKEVSV